MPGSSAPTLSEKGHALFRPWQKKGCKEERVPSMRRDNLSTSTTLESHKSHGRLSLCWRWTFGHAVGRTHPPRGQEKGEGPTMAALEVPHPRSSLAARRSTRRRVSQERSRPQAAGASVTHGGG